MRDDEFEWDDDKAERNLKKHKVSFQSARRVFDDEKGYWSDDLTSSWNENRYFVTGSVDGQLLTVVYAYRGDRIHIISAWQSTRREIDDYYRG